jgi:hypothetical protein
VLPGRPHRADGVEIVAHRAGWWARLWAAVAFGLAGVLVPAGWFGPILAGSRNPVSFLLFLGLPGVAAAVAGALLGRPLVAPSRPRSGCWAARRGAVIATVALMLFAPMFATAITWTEPGWTSVVSLGVLVLWFAFMAVWWVLAAVGAAVGWVLYRWASTVRG